MNFARVMGRWLPLMRFQSFEHRSSTGSATTARSYKDTLQKYYITVARTGETSLCSVANILLIRQYVPRVSLLDSLPPIRIASTKMSSFASSSNPGLNDSAIVTVSDDQNSLTTQRPDVSQSKLSFKSISSAASGLSAPFLRWRSSTNRSRTKNESKGDREKKRFYKLTPMSQLVAESPWTENSPTKPITVTLRYAIVEGKPEQIRLAITCQITKSDGKYAQFTNPYLDTLDNLKVSIPTAIRAELLNRLQDDDDAYEAAREFLDELFKRMF